MNCTSQEGVDLVKKFEGFSSKVYLCAGKKRTIGYGHVILPNENYENIQEEMAEDLLKRDLLLSEKAVLRNIAVNLQQNQFDALVSLTFNIGSAALQRSGLRQKINAHAALDEITHEFMRWVYARGVALVGLAKRRCEEVQMYIKNN